MWQSSVPIYHYIIDWDGEAESVLIVTYSVSSGVTRGLETRGRAVERDDGCNVGTVRTFFEHVLPIICSRMIPIGSNDDSKPFILLFLFKITNNSWSLRYLRHLKESYSPVHSSLDIQLSMNLLLIWLQYASDNFS